MYILAPVQSISMKITILFIAGTLFIASCSKKAESVIDQPVTPLTSQYTTYLIRQGQHFSDNTAYKPVSVSEMKFLARFDSSAVYHSSNPVNQYDINKLYGFSDNGTDHHQFSARIGWRWSDGALRLFAYVYNEGVVSSKEITTVNIGAEVSCSIKASGSRYIFSVNEHVVEVLRLGKTLKGEGYQLYPYFGGDEPAPHEIRIQIKQL